MVCYHKVLKYKVHQNIHIQNTNKRENSYSQVANLLSYGNEPIVFRNDRGQDFFIFPLSYPVCLLDPGPVSCADITLKSITEYFWKFSQYVHNGSTFFTSIMRPLSITFLQLWQAIFFSVQNLHCTKFVTPSLKWSLLLLLSSEKCP